MDMSSLSESLRQKLHEAGAFAVGFAPLGEVAPKVMEAYQAWISEGKQGGMDYLANHLEIRRNPALLLGGGTDPRPGGTVISMAFPYFSGNPYRPGKLKIARYALGDDYHETLRKHLRPVASWLTAETGQEARICIDTAPILERYWATEAGLGFIGRNRQLIIPGHGSCFFLAEIVTRVELPPDTLNRQSCGDCDACIKACPGKAIDSNGIDARRCHSYLTIEHRGDFPDDFHPSPGRFYGCDLCIEACPHSRQTTPCTTLPEFQPREQLLDLTADDILSLTPGSYCLLLRHSPIKRAKLDGLLRNARRLKK